MEMEDPFEEASVQFGVRTIDGTLLVKVASNRVIWDILSSERFSRKSFRRSICSWGHDSEMRKVLWEMSIPLKVKCFV